MNKGIRIAKLFGIKINIDWSWILILLLVVWNLSTAFAQVDSDWSTTFTILMGVISLLGTVPTKSERDLMKSITKDQEGVISVVHELKIRALTEEALKELESDSEVQIPPTRRQPPGPSQSNY